MKRIGFLVLLVFGAGLAGIGWWDRFSVRESGHGFLVGDYLVLAEYGYSDGGDQLRYAIFRTWPADSTPDERMRDQRVVRDWLTWPWIRHEDGRLIPAGTKGDIYFFEGNRLKALRVRMNEHTDTMPLDNMQTLDDIWNYLQQFRVDGDAEA